MGRVEVALMPHPGRKGASKNSLLSILMKSFADRAAAPAGSQGIGKRHWLGQRGSNRE